MAKKKKKAVKKSAKKWIDLIGIALGVLALAALFLPFIGITSGEEITEYSGIQALFGYTHVTETTILGSTIVNETEIFKFTIMGILPYILIAGAVAMLVLNVVGKGGKFANLIALALFVAGAILVFNVLGFLIPGETILEVFGSTTIIKNWEVEQLTMLWGVIASGVVAILGAGANVFKIISK